MTRKSDVALGALRALLERVFGSSRTLEFERTPEGLSSQVYRITRGNDRYYLRVAEEQGEDLTVDAEILCRLLQSGVRMPEVIHVVPFDHALERSALFMDEIRRIPLAAVDSQDMAVRVAVTPAPTSLV